MYTLVLYDMKRVGDQALNLVVDSSPRNWYGELQVDCISGWEGLYCRLYCGVYTRDDTGFPPSTKHSTLSLANPRHAQQVSSIYVPNSGYNPVPGWAPSPIAATVPVITNYPGSWVGAPPAPPHYFFREAVCTCDIKQLMSTGHSPSCVDLVRK